MGRPTFSGRIKNVTVNVGKEAVLQCPVDNLGKYKVTKQIAKFSQAVKLIRFVEPAGWVAEGQGSDHSGPPQEGDHAQPQGRRRPRGGQVSQSGRQSIRQSVGLLLSWAAAEGLVAIKK